MGKKNTRFYVEADEGSQMTQNGLIQIIVDKETGVKYLWVKSGYAGGLTPLLNNDGSIVTTGNIVDTTSCHE